MAKKDESKESSAKSTLSMTDLEYDRSLGSARKVAEASDETFKEDEDSGLGSGLWSVIRTKDEGVQERRKWHQCGAPVG